MIVFLKSLKWNLICRTCKDMFNASQFHAKCDNKLIVVIKSKSGNVFDGYTEQSWTQTGLFKIDPSAFKSSVINQFDRPLKMKYFVE